MLHKEAAFISTKIFNPKTLAKVCPCNQTFLKNVYSLDEMETISRLVKYFHDLLHQRYKLCFRSKHFSFPVSVQYSNLFYTLKIHRFWRKIFKRGLELMQATHLKLCFEKRHMLVELCRVLRILQVRVD